MIKKILPFAIILLLIVVIKGRIDALIDLRGSGTTVVEIRNELENEQSNNLYLTEMLKYVKTNEFVEQEARERLNFAKANEAIVLSTDINPKNGRNSPPVEEIPIWNKWVNIFF